MYISSLKDSNFNYSKHCLINFSFELKRSLFIDKHTLRRRFDVSAEETKRKKLKKGPRDKHQQQSTSGPKSSDKVESTGNAAQSASTIRYTRNENLKPANHLPHPVQSDKNRDKFSMNDSRTHMDSRNNVSLPAKWARGPVRS